MVTKIIQKDNKALQARIRDANNFLAKCGIFAGDGQQVHEGSPGTTILDIGIVHEFGYGHIPKRSFIRLPFDKYIGDIEKFTRNKYRQILLGMPVHTALSQVGEYVRKIIIKHLKAGGEGSWPPLSEVTISLKGSDKILIDTGQLWQSIHSDVEAK